MKAQWEEGWRRILLGDNTYFGGGGGHAVFDQNPVWLCGFHLVPIYVYIYIYIYIYMCVCVCVCVCVSNYVGPFGKQLFRAYIERRNLVDNIGKDGTIILSGIYWAFHFQAGSYVRRDWHDQLPDAETFYGSHAYFRNSTIFGTPGFIVFCTITKQCCPFKAKKSIPHPNRFLKDYFITTFPSDKNVVTSLHIFKKLSL